VGDEPSDTHKWRRPDAIEMGDLLLWWLARRGRREPYFRPSEWPHARRPD